MRNWKELGEVPDSDDESLDSPESQDELQHEQPAATQNAGIQANPAPQTDNAIPRAASKDIWDITPTPEEPKQDTVSTEDRAEKPTATEALVSLPNGGDIWDLPPSPQQGPEQAAAHKSDRQTPLPTDFDGPPFSPLSSVPSDIDEIDELGILPPASATVRARDGNAGHNGAPSVTKPPITFEEDEISTPYVTITAPLPGRPASIPNLVAKAPPSATPASNRSSTSVLTVQLGTGPSRITPSSDWAEPPIRGRRSLRPRKPIQQHPYLLESVQYAHVMKSHGYKPVRVLVPEASSARRVAGDDSQDREFEEESSGEQAEDRLMDVTDESQPVLFDDMDEDRGNLVLSPSPPRTSPRNMLQTSSQRSEEDRTDNTSVLEDDFPSVEQLVHRPPKSKSRRLKRQLSSKLLPQSKRLNRAPTSSAEPSSPPVGRYQPVTMFPPSSIAAGEFSVPSQDLGGTPAFSHTGPTGSPTPLAFSRRQHSSSSGPPPPLVDLTHQSEDDEASSETSSSSRASKSGSEIIRRHAKRIRGVLPASWLRIDQQKNPGPRQKIRQISEGPPEPAVPPRRGVAIRKVTSRISSPKPSTSTLPLFSDDSDDNEATIIRPLSVRRQNSPDESPLVIWSDQEDAGSVVEEDQIDRMFVGTKRNRSALDTPSTAKRRKAAHQNPFKGKLGAKRRQPRITDVLERTAGKSATAAKRHTETGQRHSGLHKSTREKPPATRAMPPPRLSVLDVLDSGAPRFLKIAARTAKRRQDLGKSSPAHKHINLGTRMDNVDALSVLRDWKSGRIRSKTTKSQTKKTPARKPLQNLSTNSSPLLRRDPGSVQRSRSGGDSVHSVSLGSDGDKAPHVPPNGPRKAVYAARVHSGGARPAQLETEEEERPDRVGFHARKRALDALFRHARKASSASSVRLEQQWDSIRQAHEEGERQLERPGDSARETQPTSQRKTGKSRFRKRLNPRPVDLQAAHYIHANDPLPPAELDEPEQEERPPPDKLYGLAPYGTKYTQHFEVFPLDRGVYFHSSSLVGSGWIGKIIDPQYPERTRQTRPRSFFSIDGKHLRWGPWDETSSSELGILVDWIGEQLLSPQTVEGNVPRARPQEAAAFLLIYIVDAISFPDDDSEKSFISRSIDVIDGFLNRIEEARLPASAATSTRDDLVEVLTYLTLVVQAVHRIGDHAMSLRVLVETLLSRTAKCCASALLAAGLENLRTLYGDLQRLSARERGIRSDNISANSWVVLMRVLENARIPRASFWDVVQAVMAGSDVASGSYVRGFERLWRDVFTLLPLGEVDDFGVVRSGMRYTTPIEGWTIPQKLLKRVFSLYTQNPRQPPSFNEYCRALAARCHYLVQEWGWRKCAGIIGTWFDFFGSQNLSHLRNEEVYKSPRFLEELGSNPSLAIDPEDRCFHIFLKVLALVIQRLKKLNLTNDIKNLVARTLPNHNRQYLKEDTVHQRDLAALRNHHDLLCTLFWAAPPDLRPGVHLIEKLVSPGSSHKEACLINLRAWSQLARFVVLSDEGSATFRSFVSWQNNIFHQVLDQYLSAASDIQQQILALPKDRPRIGDELVESMVKQNRSVAMDMLFVSIKASFEALKLAGSLRVATYALNICKCRTSVNKPGSPLTSRRSIAAGVHAIRFRLSRLRLDYSQPCPRHAGALCVQSREGGRSAVLE